MLIKILLSEHQISKLISKFSLAKNYFSVKQKTAQKSRYNIRVYPRLDPRKSASTN